MATLSTPAFDPTRPSTGGRTWRRRLVAGTLAVALGLAGCGGDDGDGGQAGGETATPPAATQTDGQAAGGTSTVEAEQIFASTCGSCHTLEAAGTSGQVGPDLDQRRPTEEEVLEAIRTGPGVMPENLLSGQRAQAVAQYVAAQAGS